MILTTVTLTTPTGDAVTVGKQLTRTSTGVYGYLLDSVDIDPAPRALEKEQPVGRTGALVAAGRRGARDVTVTGTIIGRSALEVNQLRRALALVAGDHGDDLLTFGFTPQDVALELGCHADGSGASFGAPVGHTMDFTVTLVAPDPVAYTAVDTTVALGSYSAPGVADVLGDAEVWPTITVYGDGAITGLRVGSLTAGEHVDLNGITFGDGDVLVIESRPGEENITINGVTVLAKRTSASRFWGLRPGVNDVYLTVTAGTGTPTGELAWRDGWVS